MSGHKYIIIIIHQRRKLGVYGSQTLGIVVKPQQIEILSMKGIIYLQIYLKETSIANWNPTKSWQLTKTAKVQKLHQYKYTLSHSKKFILISLQLTVVLNEQMAIMALASPVCFFFDKLSFFLSFLWFGSGMPQQLYWICHSQTKQWQAAKTANLFTHLVFSTVLIYCYHVNTSKA